TPAGQVKLTDFGIAKSMGASAVTQTGMVVGTAQYISPEQAMGHTTSPAGDVYSLAVVGYECLAGHRPFVAESPVSIAIMHVREAAPPLPDSVPEPVRRVLAEAMSKDPSRRYPDGGAFADAISDVRSGRDPRPPSAFIAAAGAAGAAGAAAGFAAGATAATTVLPEGTATGTPGPTAGPAPTRSYTQLHPGAAGGGPRGQGPAPTGPRPRTTPPRLQAPPPVTSRPPQRRSGSGAGGWFLVVFLLVALIALAGAIALSNAGVFGPGGLFGGTTTTTPRTTAPSLPPVTITTTQTPTERPTPTPSPTPEPTTQPSPTPTEPSSPDPGDLLDSITSELDSLVPRFNQQDGPQGADVQGRGAPAQEPRGFGGERG
ncbi:MAG: serine/threonine protein kinase, partial [Actinomycetales bacterium]|nr:serine/threonine protein kinase [Actinomycetales bacterium]